MEDCDIQKCLKLMNDSSIKQALIKSTEDAIEYGVYFASLLSFHIKLLKTNKTFVFFCLIIIHKIYCIDTTALKKEWCNKINIFYVCSLGFRCTYRYCSLQGSTGNVFRLRSFPADCANDE